MRNEQQVRTLKSGTEVAVVDGRHHGLARAGCSNDEVAVVAHRSLELDTFEQTLLKGLRRQVNERQIEVRATARLGCRSLFAFELARVVRHEALVVPIRLEGGIELLDHVGVRHHRRSHVPFEPGHLRLMGEVRRPDVDGGEPTVAMEQPCLGVETSCRAVIGNAHLGSSGFEFVERPLFGGAGVGGGEYSHHSPASGEPSDVRQQFPDATEANERTQDVDTISRHELTLELASQVWFAWSVGQQSSLRQRSLRMWHRRRGTGWNRTNQRRQ